MSLTYKVESLINDGMAEAPPLIVVVESIEELFHQLFVLDSLANDYGDPFGVGATLTVERIA
jgi:hypothetical protein